MEKSNEKIKTEFLLKEDDNAKWTILSNKPFGDWTNKQKNKVDRILGILNDAYKKKKVEGKKDEKK